MNTSDPTPNATITNSGILEKLREREHYPSSAIVSLAAASGTSAETAALQIAVVLGAIAGPRAGLQGPMGEMITPEFNLLAAGGDDVSFDRLQTLTLHPVMEAQQEIRENSRAANSDDVQVREGWNRKMRGSGEIYENAGKEDSGARGDGFIGPSLVWKGNLLRHPTFALMSPDPGVFKRSLNEILDRDAAIFYPGGDLFDELFRVAPSREWRSLLRAILKAMGGQDAHFGKLHASDGFGSIETFRASLVACLKADQIARVMTADDEDLRRLSSNCLILPPGFGEPPQCTDPASLRFGYSAYVTAVTRVVAARRSGGGVEVHLSDDDQILLSDYATYTRAMLPKLAKSFPRAAWVLELPWKIAWAMLVIHRGREPRESCVPFAIHVAHTALVQHANMAFRETKKKTVAEEERARRIMLEKLARLGPAPMRKILRTCRCQRRSLHEPVLEALVADGLVTRENDHYALANRNGGHPWSAN